MRTLNDIIREFQSLRNLQLTYNYASNLPWSVTPNHPDFTRTARRLENELAAVTPDALVTFMLDDSVSLGWRLEAFLLIKHLLTPEAWNELQVGLTVVYDQLAPEIQQRLTI